MGILHAYWSNLIASYGGGVDDSLGCDIFLEIYVWIQSLCQDYVVGLRAASSHFSDIQSFSSANMQVSVSTNMHFSDYENIQISEF